MIYLGTGFCPSGWNTGHGSFTFNDKIFPDPEATIRKFHDDDFKIILHFVPPGDFHGAITDTGAAADAPGDAAAYWQKHLPLAEAGVDGWWPDEGDRLSTYARLERNRMYWEGSRASFPEKRPFALHRNGYAGLQRYGWLWSGDVDSDWKTLKMQVMVGIAVGLSGVPYSGHRHGRLCRHPGIEPGAVCALVSVQRLLPAVPLAWPHLEAASALGLEPRHRRAQGTGRRLGGELAAGSRSAPGRCGRDLPQISQPALPAPAIHLFACGRSASQWDAADPGAVAFPSRRYQSPHGRRLLSVGRCLSCRTGA